MQIDRQLAKQISDEVLEALKPVGAKFNVHFSFKGGNFTSSNCTMKIEAAAIDESGNVESTERKAFIANACLFKLKPEWLDKTFSFAGEDYQIIGLNIRRHKKPVLAKGLRNGKSYIFDADHIRIVMAAQNPSTPANV